MISGDDNGISLIHTGKSGGLDDFCNRWGQVREAQDWNAKRLHSAGKHEWRRNYDKWRPALPTRATKSPMLWLESTPLASPAWRSPRWQCSRIRRPSNIPLTTLFQASQPARGPVPLEIFPSCRKQDIACGRMAASRK